MFDQKMNFSDPIQDALISISVFTELSSAKVILNDLILVTILGNCCIDLSLNSGILEKFPSIL